MVSRSAAAIPTASPAVPVRILRRFSVTFLSPFNGAFDLCILTGGDQPAARTRNRNFRLLRVPGGLSVLSPCCERRTGQKSASITTQVLINGRTSHIYA
jgi:hypothetical protein